MVVKFLTMSKLQKKWVEFPNANKDIISHIRSITRASLMLMAAISLLGKDLHASAKLSL